MKIQNNNDLLNFLIDKADSGVKNWFNFPQNKFLQHLARWPNNSVAQRTSYEQLIRPLIYPDWDTITFQVNKPSNNFYPEMDFWFYQNRQGTSAYKN